MQFDPAESVLLNRLGNQIADAATVSLGVDEGESEKSIGTAAHNARNLAICGAIVGVKCRKENRAVDAGRSRATQIATERSRGIPRPRQSVATPGVAVGVDDHLVLAMMNLRMALLISTP